MGRDLEGITRAVRLLAGRLIKKRGGRPLRLMEVCGTHTVAVFRHGIRSLLPEGVILLSGPGCPVCVTSIRDVDIAVLLAERPGAVLVTFGDMVRVPGGERSLYEARAGGADVRVVYSPLDALEIAFEEREKTVVFFATGFETTSPLVAGTLLEAERAGIGNFYLHPVHKLVPPALKALLDSGETAIDGLMLPGHVSAIIGSRPYGFLAEEYATPSVITGFGAGDIMRGILMLLKQTEAGKPEVEIQYRSVVREEGNTRALEVMGTCFEPAEAYWRGIGPIPASGLLLNEKYRHRDIGEHVDLSGVKESPEPPGCSCGEVLRGVRLPTGCPLFGRRCTPENPVGACMVSDEGSCAAYHRYGGAEGLRL
jgi:hydrogenase expression/formation protein HypD